MAVTSTTDATLPAIARPSWREGVDPAAVERPDHRCSIWLDPTYVLRFAREATVLAEGEFELVN